MYLQSIQDVFRVTGYFEIIAMVLIPMGLITGAFYNNGFKGVRQSFILFLPSIFTFLLTTINRIQFLSSEGAIIGSSAYNAIVSFVVIQFFYLISLAIGHTIVSRTVRSIYKQHGIKPNNGLLVKP